MRKTSGRRHVMSSNDIADFYANQARIAREEAERAAARELPEWEREWLLACEHPVIAESEDEDEEGWGTAA